MIGRVVRSLNLMFADCIEPEIVLVEVRALAEEIKKKLNLRLV